MVVASTTVNAVFPIVHTISFAAEEWYFICAYFEITRDETLALFGNCLTHPGDG